jgi:hypothetical protein
VNSQIFFACLEKVGDFNYLKQANMENPPLEKLFYSSLVTEHIVPKGRDFAFNKWHDRLIEVAKLYQGFLRCVLK